MRKVFPLLLILLFLPEVPAWNVTFQFHPSPGQVLDDVVLNYTARCSTWVFGTFDDGTILRDFAFFANGSGSFDLGDYTYIYTPSNSTLYLESDCKLNVTPFPRYEINMRPPEIRVISGKFRLVKIPFKRTGETQFSVKVPWKLVAIYLESSTIYNNSVYVPELPLEVTVSWKYNSITKTNPPGKTFYWVDVSNQTPTGNVTVELFGERAKYIEEVYGYALVPYRKDNQWWLLYDESDGYYLSDGRLWRNVLIHVEFLWRGNDFTLATFTTQEEKKLSLRVKSGGICFGHFPTEECSSTQLQRGGLQLTIGFRNGYLWVRGEGNEYLDVYTGTEAISINQILRGIPKMDRYSIEIHASESVPWKPEKRRINPNLILSGSSLLMSLLAIVIARKR